MKELVVAGGRGAALADGALVGFDAASGRATWKSPLDGRWRMTVSGPIVFLWSSRADGARSLHGRPVGGGAVTLRAFTLADGKPRWRKRIRGSIRSLAREADRLRVHLSNGRCSLLDRNTGDVVRDTRFKPGWFTTSTVRVAPETYVRGHLRVLRKLTAAGDLLWRRRARGPRGVRGPVWTDVVARGDRLFAGLSDGRVVALDVATGRRRAEVELESSVQRVAVTPTEPPRLVAVTADGFVHGLATETLHVTWRFNARDGREHPRPLSLSFASSSIWLGCPGTRRLVRLSSKTGTVEHALPLPETASWAVSGSAVVIGADNRIAAYSAHPPRD